GLGPAAVSRRPRRAAIYVQWPRHENVRPGGPRCRDARGIIGRHSDCRLFRARRTGADRRQELRPRLYGQHGSVFSAGRRFLSGLLRDFAELLEWGLAFLEATTPAGDLAWLPNLNCRWPANDS